MTKLSLYQSGQTPDDGEYRWMGSVAMDKMGNIALGYSRSSAASGDYPSIYYAGQTLGDPLGTTETEALIKRGSGSQYNSFDRWGDYSSMALDGADSCTFWYTTEYYPRTARSPGTRGSLRSSSRTAVRLTQSEPASAGHTAITPTLVRMKDSMISLPEGL